MMTDRNPIVRLTNEERHWIALTIADVAAERDLAEAARLIEARIETLIERRNEREWELIDAAGITWQSRARRLAAQLAEAKEREAAAHSLGIAAGRDERRRIRTRREAEVAADLANGVLIPGSPIFGCPICFDPWESEPSCEHHATIEALADALANRAELTNQHKGDANA